MLVISSNSNDKIKLLKKLHDKKFRRENFVAIIEGEKFVKEAMALGVVMEVFASKSYTGSIKANFILTDPIFKEVSQEVTPQGILATVDTEGLEFKEDNVTGHFLVLEHIQDPGNLGALIRSAAAFNFRRIYMIDCVDVFNNKTIQASAGNIFKVRYKNIKINEIPTAQNIHLIASDMKGIKLNEFRAYEGIYYGLVIGNEGQGVSTELKARCAASVSIPMSNEVESLNAAVAGSIIMFSFYN